MQFQRTLVFRALLPIAAFAILLLAAMAGFALFAIERFAYEQAASSMRLRALTVRQIADDNYGGLRRHGRVDSEVALREARVDTLLAIEDFARIQGLKVTVFDRVSQRKAEFGTLDVSHDATAAPAPEGGGGRRELQRAGQREVQRFVSKGREFQSISIGFEPWGWEITLIEPTESFDALRSDLLRGAAVTLAVLILGTGLFVFILGRVIHRPVDRIIDRLRSGRAPEYKGIAEFEFLSDAIGVMMASVREKSEKLERYQNHLEQLVAGRTAELAHANNELKQANNELKQINAELAEAQSQLLQAEKMAAIGQLAAGVAHEINNPIGFVSSNLSTLRNYLQALMRLIDAYERRLALDGTPDGRAAMDAARADVEFDYIRGDVDALLSESEEGLARVCQIVTDLKDFSRAGDEAWQFADLHQGLESTLNIVSNEIGSKAEVKRDYGALPEVECLPGQLNQVFMNLLVNAAQAIDGRGTITIRTRVVEGQVAVEIVDTGAGIPPENLSRIFNPFFTTKPVGQGSGMGLSVVYGIVKKHGGHVEVESAPGNGTCFRVLLPIRRQNPPVQVSDAADTAAR